MNQKRKDFKIMLQEERGLVQSKGEKGFAGEERLGSIKREFLGDDVDELMRFQLKDAKN